MCKGPGGGRGACCPWWIKNNRVVKERKSMEFLQTV